MPALKITANMLTIGRAGIEVIIGLLGILKGKLALKNVALLLIAVWFSDVASGFLARSLKVKIRDWIGEHDLYADMTVSTGVLYYLTSCRYILVGVGCAIFIISTVLMYHFHSIALAEDYRLSLMC
ncbi:conserved hypothetical protein [Thermoanaerobacterium thermosaccharolyticum DSM 571]|uniref:CDP-alcohol phosphatidyltransferase n=1 Tax=Thermoanaerobacterium thermosaccharolyticum (strain ATCC 7956 / DSM 571 / NCIMB 9385 / NCA 3814 / NCTC 13789 / WDCM 00135 / 2032) TaxID=580327 RepID=D9TTP2_THETC|nr:hypothetical protein [Thermoanaerobacterium thermosaccharolyticum]ADL69932.1 conserved hypothetical protein [Thermoanaerobacterium thermosaccharolyticum DSM 571]